MATLGFEVHTDKENAVSSSVPRKGINKGLSVKPLGYRDQNKFPDLPLRKALQSVNQQVPLASSQGKNFSKNVVKDSIFAQSKASKDIENRPVHGLKKKTPTLSKKSSQGSAQIKRKSKSKPPEAKTKVEVEPIPHVDISNDEEYDSDSIFPRAERLSSYVDKLLMWRPPCLFGSIPDSDPEISDREDELIVDEEIFRMPIDFAEVPDFPSPEELSEDLLELPPLDLPKDETDLKINRFSSEPLSDQSFNTSFPLGPLQMISDHEITSGFKIVPTADEK